LIVHQKIIHTGISGFGLSGKIFHAPFIETHPGFKMYAIASSKDEAREIYPESQLVDNFQKLIDIPEIDLVVIATPHQFHMEQAVAALYAGKHVVIEKPVAMSSREAENIIGAAEKAGKMVFPYHNRRWDGDFRTVRKILREGRLGEVIEFVSHFDRYQPEIKRAFWKYDNENGGGTLFDLGPHMIGQAISLFGAPRAVSCRLYFQREGSKSNDSFDISLIYPKHTVSLKAGVLVKEPGPRFQIRGTKGTFVKYGLDPQENSLKQGFLPDSPGFGTEPKEFHGVQELFTETGKIKSVCPTSPGYYMGFYEDVYTALIKRINPEITMDDALMNIKIIETAMMSHNSGKIINLPS
jgi:scyllo-inositol 2-dehydrogenase (NADP+)